MKCANIEAVRFPRPFRTAASDLLLLVYVLGEGMKRRRIGSIK